MTYYTFKKLNLELRNEKFFVVDKKVFHLHRDKLPFMNEKFLFLVEDTEGEKSFAGYQRLIEYLLRHKITRRDRIVAIGGGAIGDLAGFAASTVLRGVDWICVPTTLLSIIDSSIGGKTGINTDQGKNLVGAFHSPARTLVALEFLETLEPVEIASGRGELLKYAFLDNRVRDALETGANEADLIELCRQVKTEIVDKDFKESGERAKLNLGHTFGHVVERMTKLPHGIAVAAGLEIVIDLFAQDLNERFSGFKKQLCVEYPFPQRLERDKFWELLSFDKKRTENMVTLIIPQTAGGAKIESFTVNQLKNRFEQMAQLNEKYKHFFR